MEKTKKNLLLRSAGVLMGVSILSTCVLGGTLAKYTTSGTGTAEATVAKFDVKLNEQTLSSESELTLNLFNTIFENDGSGVATKQEDEVTSGKIAPGTSGKEEIKVKNAGEVAIKYNITLAQNSGADTELLNCLKFSTNGEDWKSLSDPELTFTGFDDGGKTLAIGAPEDTQTLYWKWDFEGDDTTDTKLGNAASSSALVDVTVTAEQIN